MEPTLRARRAYPDPERYNHAWDGAEDPLHPKKEAERWGPERLKFRNEISRQYLRDSAFDLMFSTEFVTFPELLCPFKSAGLVERFGQREWQELEFSALKLNLTS
jgi:hypothetical protein